MLLAGVPGGEAVSEIGLEPTVESKRIYQGRVVGLRVDTVRLANGRDAIREIVEHETRSP